MMESIGNPNIHLDPWLPGLLDRLEPHHMGPGRSSADRYPSLGLRSMAGMARALRDPEKRYEELLAWYEELMDDIERLQHKMKGLLATEGKGGKDHRVCLTELSLGVTAAIAHNRMLQVFHPQDASLREAGRALAEQMIDNGEQSLPHKPLGAAHVVSGLNITWAATDDPKLKARAARIIDEIYDCGFPSADRMREPKWWALKFTDVREQVRKMRSPGGLEGSPEEYRAILHQQCHIQ